MRRAVATAAHKMLASKRPVAPQGPVAQLQPLAFQPQAAAAATSPDGVVAKEGTVPPTESSPPTKLNVVKALTMKLRDTYRKADPSRPEAVDAAPRRVLTHPSFPVSNGCAAALKPGFRS